MPIHTRPTTGERLASPLARLPIRPTAAFLGVVIMALAVLGIIQRTTEPTWAAANLDSEVSVGKWIAAGLLWASAGAWFLVAVAGRSARPWVWIWWPLLAWLAADEGNAVHERLERVLETDWQLLYAPLMAVGAITWVAVWRRHRRSSSIGRLLIAGAAAWAGALLLELVQNWGGEPIEAALYDPMMVIEEIAEMIGAAVFFLAALTVLQSSDDRGPD